MNKGFTLLEVIVSIGILAVVSVLFITVFVRMVEISVANKKINEASINSESNVTKGAITCADTPTVALNFEGDVFVDAVAKMCRSNSSPQYKLFRIKD